MGLLISSCPADRQPSLSGRAGGGAGRCPRVGEIAFRHHGLQAAIQGPDAVFWPVRPRDFGCHLAKARTVSRAGDLLSGVEAMSRVSVMAPVLFEGDKPASGTGAWAVAWALEGLACHPGCHFGLRQGGRQAVAFADLGDELRLVLDLGQVQIRERRPFLLGIGPVTCQTR